MHCVCFATSEAKKFNKDNLFVIGRNIYQAACGNANAATHFINEFISRTNGLSPEKRKALLDGMLFEIFFDSDGKIRDNFKERHFNEVFKLQKHATAKSSFEFIAECLLPYSNRFYAIPGKANPLSIDVVLDSSKDIKNLAEPVVVRLCIASDNVLRADDDSDEEPSRFRYQDRGSFEKFISDQLLIPLHLLSFTYTGVGSKPTSIWFPIGWTVRKPAN